VEAVELVLEELVLDESFVVLVVVSDFLDESLSLEEDELLRPFAEADEAERESVMYQPLPLKTMPTG
jgi:hypothetical protein